MKMQLHQGRPLHIARLDMMNAADVQEVVLVVIRQETFIICAGSIPPNGWQT